MQLSPYHSTAQRGAPSVVAVCKRTNARLGSQDTRLYLAFDARTLRYEIWRDCPNGAQLLVHTLEGRGGEFVHPDNYPIQIRLHQMDMAQPGRTPQKLVQELAETNERERNAGWTEKRDTLNAVGEYIRPWIVQAQDGQPRHDHTDVIAGVTAAMGEDPYAQNDA